MPNSVADFPWKWKRVIATTDPEVLTGPGALHTIVINGVIALGDIEVYDGIDNTGALIGVISLTTAASISVQPITLTYDLKIETGIHLQYIPAVGADLTVTYL